MDRLRRRKWGVRAILALVLLLPAGFGVFVEATANFGSVVPGQTYRSAQMRAGDLARTLKTYRIQTVLNLRGPNPEQTWYRSERATTTGAGATQVDIALSSCEWMSRAQLRTLIRMHDTCDYPLLIHCEHGSERTSLVAAIFELLRPGATLRDAEAQFSLRHLFIPVKDGKVMVAHLEQYKSWLLARGLDHSPERFRQWAAEGFMPQWPTREMWPYDPKPLLVITRPPSTAPVPSLAGSEGHRERR